MKFFSFVPPAFLLLFLVTSSALGQSNVPAGSPLIPLEEMLDEQGRLKTDPDFTGSLDPAGWRLVAGANGGPRFVPDGEAEMPGPADEYWDSGFDSTGLDGDVYALALSGSDLFVGGTFIRAGEIVVNRIARWDGTQWSALGSGMDFSVFALAVSGGDLYAGGVFDTAGGVRVNGVARWDGASWSALGTGVNLNVRALAVNGSDLYVGGNFTVAGGSPAARIARWNGTSWSALAGGVGSGSDYVYALAVMGGELYAGGNFDSAGGAFVGGIAKWDGVNWSSLGAGTNGTVNSLAVIDTNLYAGGSYTLAGGSAASNIAKWDGSAWSPLGAGASNTVYSLTTDGVDLYAGGIFTTVGGSPGKRVAKWDGAAWAVVGGGIGEVGEYVHVVAFGGGSLYVGGNFSPPGLVWPGRIAAWDGASWSALCGPAPCAQGLTGIVHVLTVNGGDLYAGGGFTLAGGTECLAIARWDGAAWHALGTGASNHVYAIVVDGTDVYAAGLFVSIGGVSAARVAKWNGTSWSALGTGLGSAGDYVHALAMMGGELYAGGTFDSAGGTFVGGIAKWNGVTWSPVGSGTNASVRALTVAGTDLYAGGDFTIAGGTAANRVAMWDGGSWTALGSGTDGMVHALAVSGSDLYAGGLFDTAGGIRVNHIARWDGSNWSALGGGTDNVVLSLAVDGGRLIAGGTFTEADGATATRIARWSGAGWSPLGSGVNHQVGAIALLGDDLYAGGYFTAAGGKPSRYIGRWTGPLESFAVTPSSIAFGTVVIGGSDTATVTATNPGAFTLTISSAMSSDAQVSVSPASAVLAPFGDGVFTIIATPTIAGAGSADVVFTHEGLTSPDTVTVTFTGTHPPRTITASAGPNGSIAPAGAVIVPHGADTAFTVTPALGHHLDSLLVDGVNVPDSLTSYTFQNVTANHTIRAVFAVDTLTITATTGPNGLLSPLGAVSVTYGANRAFAILPNPLYHLDSLIVDGVNVTDSVWSYTFKNVTTNHSIRAVFAVDNFTITASADSHGTITPSGIIGVTADADRKFTLTPDPGYHTDSLLVDGVNVPESTATYTFTNIVANHTIRAVFARTTVAVSLGVGGGWNLVSVPTELADYAVASAFPTATSSFYSYDAAYVQEDTVRNGPGYWAKFSGPQAVDLTGYPRPVDSIVVQAGWNLIGSVSDTVPVAAVSSEPGGIVTSQFFGYTSGYVASTGIEPGKGYWVKVGQAGILILSAAPGAEPSTRIRIVPTADEPPPPPDGAPAVSSGTTPTAYALGQNYPNPFNPSTSVTYSLPEGGRVRVSIFNLIGQEVAVLVDEMQEAGTRTVVFDARDLPTGIYTYRMTAGAVTLAKKMLLLR